jgi:hypothetical protein
MKQLQFELWQECNSKCSFCYLGKNNTHTDDKLKEQALDDALNKISDLSIYKEYDVLSYLGGEFFQGQLNTPSIKNKFFRLMEKTAQLYNEGIVRQVWIYATMTIGKCEDLYEVLKLFKDKSNLWILTSFDTLGRFHTKKMFDTWDGHIKSIVSLYPQIHFNITSILSEDFVQKYIQGQIDFEKMKKAYNASFFFKQCGSFLHGNNYKQETNKIVGNFYPHRSTFLKFLALFRKRESVEMWDKLFNIYYRADTLYRNFNDSENRMQLNERHKGVNKEYDIGVSFNKCGHLMDYAAYIDSDACVICDKHLIEKMENK